MAKNYLIEVKKSLANAHARNSSVAIVWVDYLEELIEAYEDLDTVRAWCEND